KGARPARRRSASILARSSTMWIARMTLTPAISDASVKQEPQIALPTRSKPDGSSTLSSRIADFAPDVVGPNATSIVRTSPGARGVAEHELTTNSAASSPVRRHGGFENVSAVSPVFVTVKRWTDGPSATSRLPKSSVVTLDVYGLNTRPSRNAVR